MRDFNREEEEVYRTYDSVMNRWFGIHKLARREKKKDRKKKREQKKSKLISLHGLWLRASGAQRLRG